MRPALRLPLCFDPAGLADDLARIPEDAWASHYNTRDYEGEWSGVALRAPRHHPVHLFADPEGGSDAFADTPLLESSPALADALAALACPKRSARLLRLAPGARILEHRDRRLGFEDGEVRLHIPIVTDPAIVFVVAGQRVVMSPGECWYVDVRQAHRVENPTQTERVHLVVDCEVNAWVEAQLAQGEPPASDDAMGAVDRLVAAVVADPAKVAALEPLNDREGFLEAVLAEAASLGIPVSRGELDARMRENHRAWIERRIL